MKKNGVGQKILQGRRMEEAHIFAKAQNVSKLQRSQKDLTDLLKWLSQMKYMIV